MKWISGSNFVMGIISLKFLIEDSGVFLSFNKFYGFESLIIFSFLKAMFSNLHLTKKISKTPCCYNVKIRQKREKETRQRVLMCAI
jgi:hypothetical protein